MTNQPNSDLPTSTDLLITEEVASLLRTFPSTIRYWRYIGYGPPGLKVGRRVVYQRRDVEAFLALLASRNEKGATR